MAYHVRTEGFEGPFDLLLHLVNRQRIDVASINIAQIASQYLDEVARMSHLDLDVASDFLVVASTLLEIKAASLLPDDDDDVEAEFEDMDVVAVRDILLERLLEYKKYKNAAAALQSRYELASRCHQRPYGAPPELLSLHPDYLEGIGLDDLARHYVDCCARRDRFLLESEHIASRPIAVETFARNIHARIRREKQVMFSDLLPRKAPTAIIVVSFLAVLELMKRNMVTARQDTPFGDIAVHYVEGSGELPAHGLADDYGTQ